MEYVEIVMNSMKKNIYYGKRLSKFKGYTLRGGHNYFLIKLP